MARYIDLEIFERRIKKYVKPEIPEEKAFVEWCKDECIRQAYAMPTADVVPKSEVERLTINMNAYGLTAKRLAAENESLEIDLENMRRNLGDAREGWNDAECKVEELKAIIADHKASEERWEELYSNTKTEVAREIFEEIERIFDGKKYVPYPLYEIAELKKKYAEEKT